MGGGGGEDSSGCCDLMLSYQSDRNFPTVCANLQAASQDPNPMFYKRWEGTCWSDADRYSHLTIMFMLNFFPCRLFECFKTDSLCGCKFDTTSRMKLLSLFSK
jgi:hypothetical protein